MGDRVYRYPDKQRSAWVVDILAAADDKPAHRAFALTLAEYWGTAAPGDDSNEPHPDDAENVSWKAAMALVIDFSAIHQAKPEDRVHGGEYARDYIRMRGAARQVALLAARKRLQAKAEAERAAAEGMSELLQLDAPDEENRD